jgi:Tfp pilus assembly protein PilF
VAALKSFREVSVCDPLHPLPYLNAARVYQQLNQKEEARIHMEIALAVDPTLAMTRVDLAQHHLHLGNSAVALETLEGALDLARHVSEIRDVLTARTVALIQLELESEGLSFPTI